MNKQDFRIGFKAVWILVIISFLLMFFGTIVKLQHWDYSDIYLITGLVLGLVSWLIIISDMVNKDIETKTLWIIMMILIPSLTSIFYLIQRDKLVKIS